MEYVGIVLISHSPDVVKGIKEIIRQVIKDVPVEVAGGTDDGEIGTSIDKISAAIDTAYTDKGVLLFYDLGSAKMNAELAIEISEKENIFLIEAPLLEGAYVATVESSIGKSITEIQKSIIKHFPTK
ncbi:PTS-dependent dihydroxyacetone kinase phosphotransferase subunit DhaM [Cerasibacillus terrae]|uniref:phosphoenolpyruvate--glycerone phosphotransferase n=1 Tax=Cerasibacillus terrae TaxID=2498845 RepID=A0A5C8NIU2_9BACI|nr:dihydroxyacetone kinase phosphoryl donor subunit DhaM [Cerasibacillus terrae]TXL61719.1 PTS-dependent dihydroxyacetone kinase phosphotransferase subunit DhaM [Cerasibacillus terrae]